MVTILMLDILSTGQEQLWQITFGLWRREIFRSSKLGQLKLMLSLILRKQVIAMPVASKNIWYSSISDQEISQIGGTNYASNVGIYQSFFLQTTALCKKYLWKNIFDCHLKIVEWTKIIFFIGLRIVYISTSKFL